MAMPEMDAVKDAALKYDKPTLARLAQMGQLSPTIAVMAGMMRDRIVQSEMKPPSPPTVAQEVMQPMGQRMGLAAAAQPQMPQQPQLQGQGLAQVPVPENMFERQGMAGGGIVAFQAGGATPSFAGMYQNLGPDLQALAEARKAYMGDFPTESAEDRRRELLAQLAVQFGGALASTPGSFAEGLGAGAKAIAPTVASGLSEMRKDRMARLAAERAEKGKVFEGVISSRQEAAKLASEESRAKADREAKITAANIAAGKQTDMKYYADQVVKARNGDKEAQIIVEAIQGYLPLVGAAGMRGQAALTSATAGAEGKALGAYKEARATVERMLGPLGADKKLRNEYNAIKDPAEREAFIDNLVEKEMARASAATKAFATKGLSGGQPGAAATNKVPQGAVDLLKSNPSEEAKKQFDAVFGPGAAARALATK